MRFRLGWQSSGHFSPAAPEPAPKPAEQPSHPAWQSGSTAGFRPRPAAAPSRARPRVPPNWVRQAPYARRFRTKAARSARCACRICAVLARCSRQYTGRVPGGPFPRISRTLASWARESMAGAIVSEQSHVGPIGFRLQAALALAILLFLHLEPSESAPSSGSFATRPSHPARVTSCHASRPFGLSRRIGRISRSPVRRCSSACLRSRKGRLR
jgi:hypothetical protein